MCMKADYFSRDYIRRIYSSLMDDESRSIFEARLNYSITGSERYMRSIIELAENKVKRDERWKNLHEQMIKEQTGLYIYGCGMYGKEIFLMADDVKWKGFIDQRAYGKSGKLQIYTPEDFIKGYRGEKVVVSSENYKAEMMSELIRMGISSESIIDGTMLPSIIEEYQYFDLTELPHMDFEVFADIGAYDGMSSVRFNEWCSGKGRSVCFEPDRANIERLKKNIESQGIDFELIQKGAWDRETELQFADNMESISHIIEDASDTYGSFIPVTTIDNVFDNANVTFIKMDIEGAELKALLGAEKTIKRCRPKLAICVYHKPEDMWEIPSVILDFNSDYHLYLRHYSLHNGETVLYAI